MKKNLIEQEWFLLGQPWCHSEESGMDVLAGDEDPHRATMLFSTQNLDADDELDYKETKEVSRAIAAHIVDLHNMALAEANKGTHLWLHKLRAEQGRVKALERQLGEAAEEISGLSRACTAQFETITGLGLQLTTLRQSLQRAEGERVGYKRFVDNGIRVFMNPCEKHSGENTPPLPEFLEKYGDKCIPCLVDELAGFRKPLTASDGDKL
jgi:uncharacterized coiled-coil protein SlyX